jgi:hypothetical protein
MRKARRTESTGLYAPVPDVPLSLEIQSKRKLDLPAGPQANRATDRALELTEGCGSGRTIRLPRLDPVGFGEAVVGQRVRQRRGGIRELSKLNGLNTSTRRSRFLSATRNVLGPHQVNLLEVRTVKRPALQVAVRAWLRRRERCGIQEQ